MPWYERGTLFSGKVLQHRLTVFDGKPPADAPPIKRLILPQGELAQFLDSDEPVCYAAYLELAPAGVRGNHYHDVKEEQIYVIAGELQLTVEDVASKKRETLSMSAGTLTLIKAGIAHAFRTVQPGHAIELAQTRFTPEDFHAYELV